MTNKEIKLELAKHALDNSCFLSTETFMETLRNVYEWIMEEPKTDIANTDEPKSEYDKIDIREVIRAIEKNYRTGGYGLRLTNICFSNCIATVGDLLRTGRRTFIGYNNVGKSSIIRIDEALEELYGITSW